MDRDVMIGRIESPREPWDVIVIGGGATGLGCAVDAALRGYNTVLFERADFAGGTSSRSTKLIHGGVRYLRRGNLSLVLESLKERGLLHANAPHLVDDLRFVVPAYDWWEGPFYGIGLRIYDVLAGKYGFGRSRNLSKQETEQYLPTIETSGLRGGVEYFDGQFDDARLAINLAQTAADLGATMLNYVGVEGLIKSGGAVTGVSVRDAETGRTHRVEARVVINATGVHVDTVRRLDDSTAKALIRPSRGSHIVLDPSFLPGDTAIMVPHTDDGRVLFAIPWYSRVLVGTTEADVENINTEPVPSGDEIDYLLSHVGRYLTKIPTRADILSAFAGLRPLVGADPSVRTASIARDHEVIVSDSGLVTIAGGKWTTYRKMAQVTVDRAAIVGGLDVSPCTTHDHRIHGHHDDAGRFGILAPYGADAPSIQELISESPALAGAIHDRLDNMAAEVVWATRHEMARTVADVLARRTRALFLDAQAAIDAAPRVARIMATELGRDDAWITRETERFEAQAIRYLPVT